MVWKILKHTNVNFEGWLQGFAWLNVRIRNMYKYCF